MFVISYRTGKGRLVPSVYTFSSPCSPSYPSSPSFPASCLLTTSGVRAQRSGARPLLAGCLHGCLEGWMAGWIAMDVLLERPENVAPGTA